ncbi:MAG: CHAT domain-containing protein [Longimicrobiales bacterium]|nr:CHAT domain-containing protein [Longimicrobiales bacterium]
MTILPLLLAGALSGAAPQEASQTRALIDLAVTGSQEMLVAEVRGHPDAAREALHDIMRRSVLSPEEGTPPGGQWEDADALGTAERLARAYFEAWTDPFLLQEVERFRNWSMEDRRTKLDADSLRILGNEAYLEEGVPPAMGFWRISLDYSERLGDPSGISKALGNLGAGFYVAGEPDSAQVYLASAYQGATEIGDFRTAASAVTNLANLAFDDGDLQEAADLYTRAVVVLSRTGEDRHLSAVQHNLALVSMDLGDLGGARGALEQSIQLSRLHGYSEDEAESLSTLADIARWEGEYQEAADLLERALTLSRETGNRVAGAGALHSSGILWLARGDYRKAVDLLEEALSIYTELGRLPDAISVREDLARARVATGDLRAGIQDLQAASRLVDSLSLGPLVKADLVLTGADLHLALNDYPRALELFREAEGLYSGANSLSGRADALEGQGLLNLARGDHGEAQILLSRTLRLRNQSDRPDPRASSLTGLYLASAQEESGDVVGARQTLVGAGDVLAAVGDAVGEAAVMATLGDLEARAHAPGTADSLFRRGLRLLDGGDAPEVEWRLHAGRAQLYERSGNLKDADDELRLAIGAVERSGLDLPHEERARLRADKTHLYTRAAGILVRLGDVESAFEMSERNRARRTLAALSGGRLGIPAGPPPGLLEREQDVRRRLRDLTLEMTWTNTGTSRLREADEGEFLRLGELRAALTKAQVEYAQLLTEMRTSAPAYSSLVDPTPSSVGQISSLLQPDQALLEYLVADDNTLVFVVTPDTVAAMLLDIGSESLSDMVGFARGVIEGEGRNQVGQLWRSPMQRLHGALVQPIERAGLLVGRSSLVFVPHGELHYLPFQALIDASEGTFLVERYAVSYAPSASSWARIRDRSNDRQDPAAARAIPPGSGEIRVLALAPRDETLPGSRYEAEVIGRLFGDRARVLMGEEASEEAFRQLAPGFDIVHLATYGRLNKVNPLFSHVEMALTARDPGLLEVHEIFGLGLQARLLTLSACETALGSDSRWDVPPGDDWVSLASAFLGAGAANVVASLWRVEDLATADLMRSFYGHLAVGTDLAESLAKAQRELISNPVTAHPFYWAGFQLVGEGGGIR